LTNRSKEILDEVATIIKKHSSYNYNIQGHTDSRGNEKLNIILSQNRAKSVKDYLISQKVDEKILSYEGFGSSSPIADNATRAGRVQNRRVVFEIVD
jgi:outer membrane protein OmpA-like peptidoglycan-associated protein